jgi:signal peptidase I
MHRVTVAFAAFGFVCLAAFVAFVLLVGLEARGGRSFRNVSAGMEPAILPGDYLTMRPISPDDIGALQRGTLIAHAFPPEPSKTFVKRLVGLPGDTLQMISGRLRINGRLRVEPYAWHADSTADPVWDEFRWQRALLPAGLGRDTATYRPSRDNWGPLVLPADHFFVLGDNRDNSLDSRYWGLLTPEQILGLPTRVYLSRDPKTGHVRWSRIGRRLM